MIEHRTENDYLWNDEKFDDTLPFIYPKEEYAMHCLLIYLLLEHYFFVVLGH